MPLFVESANPGPWSLLVKEINIFPINYIPSFRNNFSKDIPFRLDNELNEKVSHPNVKMPKIAQYRRKKCSQK